MDENTINASGADDLKRLADAINKVNSSLDAMGQRDRVLAGVSAQMEKLVTMVSTSMSELAGVIKESGMRNEAAQRNSMAKLVQESERGWEKMFFSSQKALSRAEAQQDAANTRRLNVAAAAQMKLLEQEMSAENKRAAALQASYDKTAALTESAAAASWKNMLALEAQKTASLGAELQKRRALEEASAAASWKSMLELEAKKAASYSRQQSLNTAQAQRTSAGITTNLGSLSSASGPALNYQGAIPGINSNRDAITSHNQAMREAHSLARGLAGSLGGLWLTYGSLVPLAAGAAIAASLKNVLSLGMQVEGQLNFVLALGRDLNALNVNQNPFLTQRAGVDMDSFLRVSDTSLRSITEAGEAMRGLAQNGQDFTKSIALLPTVLNLATVGEMTAGQAAISLTGAISAFGLQITDAGRVADIFAKTAADSNTSVLAMTESMKQASTVSSLFKVSIEETAAMIGLLAKINITGGAAGTSFTNMLTGLYEPTNQARNALKELGVSTSLATGQLKPITPLLFELRASLANLNDSARADILGRIFTVRGLKSAQLALENLDTFVEKQESAANAAGFMAGVVQQLEDSSDGAFKRLAVTVQRDFVGAFAMANPYVQELGQHLTDLFRNPAVTTGLGNFTTNLVRMTTALVDNLGAVTALVGGYLVYRAVLSPLIALYSAYAAAQATSTAAAVAATAAQGTYNFSVLASTGSTAAYVTMLEAQTAATVTATAASRALSAFLLPALGAIGIAIGIAAAAWLLFSDNTSKADENNLKLSNSLGVVHDALDREIERLQQVNSLWDQRSGKYRDASKPGADMLAQAQKNVSDLEAKIRAQGQDPDEVRNPTYLVDPASGMTSVSVMSKYSQALLQADENLRKLTGDMERYDKIVTPGKAIESAQRSAAQLNTELDSFIKLGTNKNSAGAFDQQNESLRNIYTSATKIKEALNDPQFTLKGVGSGLGAAEVEAAAKAEQARISRLKTDLKQLNEQAQAGLSGRAPKVNGRAANDGLRADLERLQLAKQLLDVQQKTDEMQNQADNKAGKLGDLGLLAAQNQAAKEKVQTSLDTARASMAEVQGIENKRAAAQKFANQEAVATEQLKQLDLQLAISKADMFRKMSDESVKFEAKTLADRGQYVGAYLKEYEADYAPTIKRVEADITASTDAENTARLQSYLAYLNKVKAAGVTEAVGKSLQDGFNKDLQKLQSDLSDLASQSSGQAGLGAIFNNASAAASAYSEQIGRITVQQQALQALADANPENSKLQEDATAEMDKLRNLADQMRSVWVSVGQQIGDSLTAAFGRGGTALGGLLQATIAYGAKKSQIEDVKNRADSNDPVAQLKAQREAAQATYSAQLAYYGKLASAAKGYFKEGSVGYKAMGAIEKATQVANLAEAVRIFVAKSSMLTGLLGIQVASQAEAAAAEGAYTLSSIAMAGARAAASGIAAAVSAMVGWPFPLNLIALAATVAAVGALGVKIAGGGGGSSAMSSADRQKANGTGSILGDPDAKSESIVKSLEALDKTSGLQLAHTVSMDNSLKSLVANISGLANLLVQGTNLTTTSTSATKAPVEKLLNSVTGGSLGEKLTGGLSAKLWGSIFGGKKTVEDVGLTVNSGSLASLMAGNVDVKQYTDIKKKGGLFSSDKYSTDTTSLGSEVNDQFTKIFNSLYDSVVAGANMLGLGGDAFTQKLKGFVVNLGEISTKDMTGEQIQTALQNAFSKLGDDMAKFGVDGLQQFQKVGEGYLETLARVANDFMQVNDVLAVLGKSFNVTGLAAISLSESLIAAAGDLQTLTENTAFFVENFLTEAERMAPIMSSVEKVFQQLGISGVSTIDQFKQLVLSQDLSTTAGQQMYAQLLAIAPAFKTIAEYSAEMAGTIIKSASEIRNERQDLQDQLDSLTMTPEQLAGKERAKVDPSNLALYDQVLALTTAAQNYSDKLSIQAQIYQLTGNAVGAAAVLEQQHTLALRGMSAETAKLTKELWAAQAAAEVRTREEALRSAYQSQKSALESVISAAKKFQESMLELRDSLQQGDLSTLSPEKKLDAARNRYEELLARARAGDKDAQGQVGQAAQNYLTADRAYNASNSVYAGDAAKVQKDLASLAAFAGSEANVAQAQLDALTKQVGALIKLDDTLNSGFLKVQQAIMDLAAVLGAGGGAATSGVVTGLYSNLLGRAPDEAGAKFWGDALNSGVPLNSVVNGFVNSDEYRGNQLDKMYKDVLGREADAGGKEFWMNALKSGVSMADVEKGFYSSQEYLKKHSHAKGGMAYGPSLVGEKGAEFVDFSHPAQVYTAEQTAGMFAPRKEQPLDPRVVELLEKISRDTGASVVQRATMAEKEEELMQQQNLRMDKMSRQLRQANTTKPKEKAK